MAYSQEWFVAGRRGKVRGPPGGHQGQGGAVGGAGASAGGGVGGGAGGGAGGGGFRPRTKLRSSETKANFEDIPNTVVLECREFLVLPPESVLVEFLYETVLPDGKKDLIKEVVATLTLEQQRKFLVKMSSPESMDDMATLLSGGVAWPGFRNEAEGRDVIVRGYSMQKPIMEITISDVGWWTTKEMIHGAISVYGEVKELINVKDKRFPHISSSTWKVRMVRKQNAEIPAVIHHLMGWNEREVWKIWYRGVPKVCYNCLQHDHIQRDCNANPVTLMALASQPGIGEEIPEIQDNTEQRRTFAQVLKATKFKVDFAAKQELQKVELEAMQRRKEENIAKQQENKERKIRADQERREEVKRKEAERSEELKRNLVMNNAILYEMKKVNANIEIEKIKAASSSTLELYSSNEDNSNWAAIMNQEDVLTSGKRPFSSPGDNPDAKQQRKSRSVTPLSRRKEELEENGRISSNSRDRGHQTSPSRN